jgi:hypothetical protein
MLRWHCKERLGDIAILVATIIAVPLAILIVGTPIVLVVRLLIELVKRLS